MRSKLFLSYSRGDWLWRDRFLTHLKTMFHVGEEVWVDLQSSEEGREWKTQLERALSESKCALLLVTPNYLEHGRFSREELAMLGREYQKGLRLLPVLVERCSWENEPILAQLQFVRWQNNAVPADGATMAREELRALKDAGDDSAIDSAVLTVSQHVRNALGAAGQTTREERDELFEATKQTLGGTVELEEAIYSGDFSVVYRGRIGNQPVAVKAIPDVARRNRMREIFEDLMRSLERLRDPAFIKVRYSVLDRGPQCVVMEYVDWPTLADTLAQHPGRRLPPTVVAKLLATIARAQGDAHRCGVQVGPLSSANIHASETWDLRISPLRLKGQLARAAGLTTGQLVNWELLTTLTPELWDGRQPATLAELDRHEQYYLGMFGLQLLLGRSPFAVHRFDDLLVKARFFENPRAFFDDEASGAARWTDDCPGLAFVLTRLLARDPAARFQSVDDVIEELEDVERGKLPHSARRRLELDLRERMGPEFIASFYDRLFALRPELRTLFRTPHTQPKMLADALQDLAAHRPHSEYSRFLDKAKQHAAYGITADDVDAFRTAFLEHVAERCPPQSGSRDAWAAALGIGLALMKTHLVARTRDASAS